MKNLMIYLSGLFLAISFQFQAQESFQVKKTGSGQPILLLPGFTCTSEVFSDVTDSLSENYEIHAFTFAGFGEVPPISFPWLPQIKKDIQAYVKSNHLKDPIILGHSMGGTLGLWLASEDDRYSSLIIIDALPAMGALMMPDFKSESISYESPHNQLILEMEEEAFSQMAAQMASGMSINENKHQQIADWMREADRQTYVYGYTDLLKLDLRPELQKIKTPVSILAATHPYGKDLATTNYEKQYQNLKNYNLNFAEDSGHFIMFDKPQWLLEQIHAALPSNE